MISANRPINLSHPAVFIADCHIPLIVRRGQEQWRIKVERFLKDIAGRFRTLIIVGDLFDFWFEWRHSIPSAAFPILSVLYNLKQQGLEIVYLGGNHDGHIGRFLSEEIGIIIYREPFEAVIANKRFYIIHGDGIAPADRGYRMLRRLVRWKPVEWVYRLIHPDVGIWFAYKLSSTSREFFSGQVVHPADSYREFALKKLDEGYNFVVMGHRHECEFIPHQNGGFLAIGDWIRSGSYGVFDGENTELKYYINKIK